MRNLLSICALCVLFSACGKIGPSHFKAGVELMETNPEEAERHFMQAVLDGDNTARAHYYLAALCEKEPDKTMLAVWHLRQYLTTANGLSDDDINEVEEWIQRLERQISIAINRRLGENISDETTLRLKLLEEHAVRQKLWIQELTKENIQLRNALADQKDKD